MNVLHVTPAFAPAYAYGGPIPVLQDLCLHVSRLGHEVRVLTTNSQGVGKSLGVPTHEETRFTHRLNVRYCKRVARHSISIELLRLLPKYVRWSDVVHLTAVYSFPTMPTLLLCNLFKKPVLWSPHGVLQRWEGSSRTGWKAFWEVMCKAISHGDVRLHASSLKEADESRGRFPKLTTVVIPWGVNIGTSIHRSEQQGPLRLLYLGRLDAKKGIENLIDACRILSSVGTFEWSLTIAGSGPLPYARSLAWRIKQAGLDADGTTTVRKIRMIGEVAEQDKDILFARSDVLVVPSYTENFSVVVGEALAREVPVIASEGTPWSQLQEVGCGLCVGNSPQAIAEAILKISRLSLREMGQCGRRWVTQEFSWSQCAERMVQCYGQMWVRSQESGSDSKQGK
jgi:glycosyltransferase involved in cell wall biosynthesis